MLGLFGGLLYVAVRPWLPRMARTRGLAFGAFLLMTCGGMVIEKENFDFHRFGIPLINIGLFAALFLLFGLLVAPLADRADQVFPTLPPRRAVRPSTLLAYAVLAASRLLGLLSIGIAIGAGLLGQGEPGPEFRLVLQLFLYLLVATLVAHLVLARVRGDAAAGSAASYRARHVLITGVPVLAPPLLIGVALLLQAIAAILHAAG